MESVAVAIPIKQGKAEAWKQYVAELSGKWRNEYEASKLEFGIHREAAWLQRTPNGDLAILYREVEDQDRARQELSEVMNSDEEFYTWKRNNYTEIFGMDPNQPIPEMPELLVDQRLSRVDT